MTRIKINKTPSNFLEKAQLATLKKGTSKTYQYIKEAFVNLKRVSQGSAQKSLVGRVKPSYKNPIDVALTIISA
jgi:hypothetical protein